MKLTLSACGLVTADKYIIVSFSIVHSSLFRSSLFIVHCLIVHCHGFINTTTPINGGVKFVPGLISLNDILLYIT